MSNRAARRHPAKHATAGTRPAAETSTQTVGAPTTSAAAQSDSSEPEALVVSHYFDSSAVEDAGTGSTIRLTGRRIGAAGGRQLRDVFTQEDRVDGILPGSGTVSVTSWVYGLQPGEWQVSAELLGPGRTQLGRPTRVGSIRPARWSWRRWALSDDEPTPVKTRWARLAPLASIPGVIPGIWPFLGALAILVAMVVEGLMLPHERIAGEVPLLVPLVALGSGLLAAKIWYAVLHPGPWRKALLGGWAVDGFLLAAPIVAVAILLVLGLPVAAFLDAVTPGLFLGVAIGRIGCFLAGCCAGRVTTSRWGVWSSDRRIGARRIPAQILESVAGLTIAAISTLLILTHVPRLDGVIFVGAFAVYLVVRQSLLRVRAERRAFLWRRATTAGLGA
jgi:phosphatidylglycerol:prolipoprotein diacylglycerol transferase